MFPCRTKNGTHLKEANAAWIRIMARAGLQDKHIHDLRRTHGTWLVNQGASLEVIAKALGHASLSATKIYARLSLEAVRESVERATQSMLQLLEGPANDQT